MQQIELLMKYQELDRSATQIEDELRKSEVRKKLLRARKYLLNSEETMGTLDKKVVDLRRDYETMGSEYERLTAELSELEKDVQDSNEQLPLQMAQRLTNDISDILSQLDRLEKDMTNIRRELERIDVTVRKITNTVPVAKKDYVDAKKIYDKQLAEIKERVQPYRDQMEALEPQIDATLLGKYKNARSNHAVPLVQLSHGRCMGCNMDLPSGVVKAMADSGQIIECENCGRLLYMAKEN